MTTKIGLLAIGILALLLLGAYAKGIFDEAGQADLLRKQIAATAEKIDLQNAVAKQTEAELQANQRAFTALNKKWNAIRAQNDRSACQLDAGTIGLLKDASAVHPAAR